MAGSFKKLYEEDISSVSEVTIQHDLDRVVCAVRFCTNGAIRNDLIKCIVPSEDDPRNKITISFTETISSGNIQIVDSNYIWSTLPSPEGASRLENYGGMVIAQTVVGGASTTFSCESNSTSYKQINDDTYPASKATITFTVPTNNKVIIRMVTAIRDYDPGADQRLFYVRITDSNSENTQGSWGDGKLSDEQLSGFYTNQFSNHTFQWYFDGDDSSLGWNPGELKTMYFQLKVQASDEQISVKAGGSYSPMSIVAISVPDDVNYVDMDSQTS